MIGRRVLNGIIMLVNSLLWTLWYAVVSIVVLILLAAIAAVIMAIFMMLKEGYSFDKLELLGIGLLGISLIRPLAVGLILAERPEFDLI